MLYNSTVILSETKDLRLNMLYNSTVILSETKDLRLHKKTYQKLSLLLYIIGLFASKRQFLGTFWVYEMLLCSVTMPLQNNKSFEQLQHPNGLSLLLALERDRNDSLSNTPSMVNI